jgi:limonene-1,2-epoxide hydrolase
MARSGNLDTVLEFCRVWQERDLKKILQFFSPDCFYHNMPVDPVIGIDAIAATLKPMVESAQAIEFVMKSAAESAEGTVLTERVDRFQLNGKWIVIPVMGTFELKDGKIFQWREYYDQGQFNAQKAVAVGGVTSP